MLKRLSVKEFVEKAKKIHGDKYNYSKVEYANAKTKVCIVCPEHGEFWQMPDSHLRGKGCPKCWIEKLSKIKTTKWYELVGKMNKIHNNKYSYDETTYIDTAHKLRIVCPEHGDFWQTPDSHLRGSGCPKCANKYEGSKNGKMGINDFILKAKEIHGNKYDYSKVEYINNQTKVCIICPEHGEFWQTPGNHLSGHNCFGCSGKGKKNKKQFIEDAEKIHGDKYDYSKVEYVNYNTKVCIICPKHGEFWQTPGNHLMGKGCPCCNESKLEKYVSDILKKNNVNVEYQKKFDWLINDETNYKLSLDFYLPDYNIAIECQGSQHYEPVDFAGNGRDWAKRLFEQNVKRDKTKLEKVLKHNIKMIYVNDENKDNFLKDIL